MSKSESPATASANTPPRPLGRPYAPPLLLKIQVPLKLPRWLKEWMDSREESRARLIEAALVAHFKLTPPRASASSSSSKSGLVKGSTR